VDKGVRGGERVRVWRGVGIGKGTYDLNKGKKNTIVTWDRNVRLVEDVRDVRFIFK